MVRVAARSVAASALVRDVRSTAQARVGARSASGLPAASRPVKTPVTWRNSRRATGIVMPGNVRQLAKQGNAASLASEFAMYRQCTPYRHGGQQATLVPGPGLLARFRWLREVTTYG